MTEITIMHDDHECRLLTRHEVLGMTRMSNSTLYRKMALGTFPQRIRIGDRMVRRWRCEVMEWLNAMPRG